MARILRSPAVLMTVYVAVFAFEGPYLATGPGAHRNLPELLIAVGLAIFAAHGSRAARVLMIAYTSLGVLIIVAGSTHSSWALAPRFLSLVCCVLQIALLVSSPMYERTRPDPAQGQSLAAPWLPVPPIWTLLVSGGAGLGIISSDRSRIRTGTS